MQSMIGRTVVMLVEWCLHVGDRQDLGRRIATPYRAFESGEQSISRKQSIHTGSLRASFVLETGVGRVVRIEPRHLVHSDDEIDWRLDEVTTNPRRKALVTPMVRRRVHGCEHELH